MAIRNDCKIINKTNRALPDVVTVLPISFSYFYETHTHIISVCIHTNPYMHNSCVHIHTDTQIYACTAPVYTDFQREREREGEREREREREREGGRERESSEHMFMLCSTCSCMTHVIIL